MAPRLIDPRIKLRHLICFREVAKQLSVVNAAETLNISQPAASKTVRELEEIIGVELFDRSGRRIALTPAGEMFLRYSTTSLSALRRGLEAIRGAEERPILRIGALPTVSAQSLPEAVRQLSQSDPQLRTRIITGPNDYLLSLLRTGDVDLVIGRMARAEAMLGLSFEHLYFEKVVMVVRPGHPLLAVAEFTPAMIEPYQLMLPTPNSVIRTLVNQVLLSSGLTEVRDEIETVSNAFGRSYIRETDAIWLISEGVVKRDVEEGYLGLLPFDMRDTIGPVGFTTRTDTRSSEDALAFMQAMRVVSARARAAPHA